MTDTTPSAWLTLVAQPQIFVPAFVALWLVASALMARMAGWRSLGRRHAAVAVPAGHSFRFVSASMGSVHWPLRYRNCLRVVITETGLYAAVMFPFGYQCPALLLPWSAIESVSEKQLFSNRNVTFRVRGEWAAITLSGPIGQLAKAACERAQAAG